MVLWMEEILHHLGCRISSIHSMQFSNFLAIATFDDTVAGRVFSSPLAAAMELLKSAGHHKKRLWVGMSFSLGLIHIACSEKVIKYYKHA
jgi:hypothetical protein